MNVNEPEIAHATDFTDETPLSRQWNLIDWKKTEAIVNNLQLRIARAAKEENWTKVRKLSRLLTRSKSAKLLAVRIVTTNKGKRTPGIDGVIWTSNTDKVNAVLNLNPKGYRATPLRRRYIPKKNGKFRPLSIPTMYDRAMQTLYSFILSPIESVTGDKTSFGFRAHRSTHDACIQLFNCLSRKNSAQWILEGDIKSCFDEISHQWLLQNAPMDKQILKEFLHAGYVEDGKWFASDKGTPQGGTVSPILANITLNGMAAVLNKEFQVYGKNPKRKSRVNKHKINFVRYADDFVVTADSAETAEKVKEVLSEFLKPRGLKLSEEKTRITHINDGFDFLGWNVRKYKARGVDKMVLLIKPNMEAVKRIRLSIKEIIDSSITKTQEELIKKLNPVITGWANYYRFVVSKDIFSHLDNDVYKMLVRWTKKRHYNKSAEWMKQKYWHTQGNRNYVFCTNTTDDNARITLNSFSEVKIRRYCPAKLDANPFLDREYFKDRKRPRDADKSSSNSFNDA